MNYTNHPVVSIGVIRAISLSTIALATEDALVKNKLWTISEVMKFVNQTIC